METTCRNCKTQVEEWNKSCGACGFRLVLEPEEAYRTRVLRRPSIGALFWTQGWTLGSRLYGWFLISLIPPLSPIALVACLMYGRRWAWKRGAWADWAEFESRMRLLDALAIAWVAFLGAAYLWFRYTS